MIHFPGSLLFLPGNQQSSIAGFFIGLSGPIKEASLLTGVELWGLFLILFLFFKVMRLLKKKKKVVCVRVCVCVYYSIGDFKNPVLSHPPTVINIFSDDVNKIDCLQF